MNRGPAVIVFSHLRWDSVFQRPHQLLTRIAQRQRVIFVEEPCLSDQPRAYWEFANPRPGIIVCRPHSPIPATGFCDEQLPMFRQLIPELVHELKLKSYITWFYTPLAIPLLELFEPEATVYDCMDALDKFANASPALVLREEELLQRANLVFTGGPSLYRRIEGRHINAHCFPSSVDAAHFAKATQDCPQPATQAGLPNPRLGYFGVIDERLDLGLIEAVATQRPEWQIVMVGPIVKISPETLPRRDNIHYLGQQPYDELPNFVAGWNVCMMPFALNDATEFISPTKVLEYMAAEKPIVSTSITDVAMPYGHIVYLADTATDFIAAGNEALTADLAERERRISLMRRVLSSTSWDLTVQQMLQIIDHHLKIMRDNPDRAHPRSSDASRFLQSTSRRTAVQGSRYRKAQPPVVVVGAGPTGLSAAYHLGSDSLLLEKNKEVGGLCRSLTVNGFTFDYAGHIMFSNDPYVHEMYKKLLGENVHWQDREAWIFSKNVYTRYPFQGALYGLPSDVIKECIMGAIEARYGTSKPQHDASKGNVRGNGNGAHHANGHSNGVNSNGNGLCPSTLSDCCADGILESTARLVNGNGNGRASTNGATKSESFEDFIYRVWGAGIAKHFAIPYNKKLWAVPLSEMETSWLGGRVPMPDLGEMIEGALSPVSKPMGPNARFGYPLRGGFQALMNGFLPFIKDQLRLNARVQSVSALKHVVELTDGTRIPYRQLISTMPLPVLIRAMGDDAPDSVREAVAKLRYVSVRCVHLGIGRETLTEKHWIYYPEETVFHRIFVQGNASPFCNPPGGFGLTCEITYSPHKPLPCDGDELVERTIADCRKVGFFREDDPVWATTQVDLPYAYVVYGHDRARNVKVIRDWLATQDIILAGRYSEWEYYNSDHAFIAGRRAAEKAKELLAESAAERPAILPHSDINFSETLRMER
jgi:UDP-galactopyranose mutase